MNNAATYTLPFSLTQRLGAGLGPQLLEGPFGPGLSCRGVSIHQAEDPAGEAAALLEQALAESGGQPSDLALVFGLGLGWHLAAIRKRFPDMRLVVMEPAEDLVDLYRKHNVPSQGAAPEIVANWRDFQELVGREVVYGQAGRPLVMVQPGYRELWPEAAASFLQFLRQEILRRSVIDRTRQNTGEAFLENLAANAGRLRALPDLLLLKGRMPARPAFVVGAGPSLSRDAVHLQAAGRRGFVIAAASALKPLLAAGVSPDVVLVLESEDTSAALTLDSSEMLVLGKQCVLALASGAHPAHFEVPDFHQAIFHVAPGAAQLFGNGQFLPQGGNSGSAAFALAYLWGFRPLILVGQDQAYEGDSLHAAGTEGGVVEEEREGALKVGGVNGGAVETHSGLLASLGWFAEAAQSIAKQPNPPTLINAASGGAKIPGFQAAPLDMIMPALPEAPSDLQLASVLPKLPLPNHEEINKDIAQMAGLVDTLRRLAMRDHKRAFAELGELVKISRFMDLALAKAKVAASKNELLDALNQADGLMSTLAANFSG